MKVYIDELPKSCEECPMCRSGKLKLQRKGRYVEAEQCVFGQYKYRTIDDEIDTCPLQSLADYTKQVCEKIRKELKLNNENSKPDTACCVYYDNMKEILDQIENEKKESN